ncbi:MAG: mechanosensitive ion channel family protein [Dysgonamonadaceae bacterium]|jgi:miniconductance mechanosensitive channel|nr:mechanosensitive ion channel family protein [Dysgonamonadaceae bacterium]
MNGIFGHFASFFSQCTFNKLIEWGISEQIAVYLNTAIMFVFSFILVYIVQYLTRRIIRGIFNKIAQLSHVSFFKYLVNNYFPRYLAQLLPYMIIKKLIPVVFSDFPGLITPLGILTDIYLVFLVILIIMSLVKSGMDLLVEKPVFKDKPMTSYIQVIRLILFLFGIVIIFSIITGKSPTVFFTAMGAASAILLLMFKDSIMGFVASIQVAGNDMVRLGDWITVPKYGADGDVIEINLTTVKVQNFDKTITTLPTYALISDSFQNWRGMQMSGGRRIKRSIIIKQSSIRFVEKDELQRFKKIQGISAYIDNRQVEIDKHNEKIGADRSIPINGRTQTNAGLFRKYAEWYLENHPGTRKDLTLMVRQLSPTEMGLPFELYVFTNTTNWVEYEFIMADIFDHLIAAVKYFDLQIFEREAGGDIKNIIVEKPK